MGMFFDRMKNSEWAKNIFIVTQFGLTIAGCIVFCFFIGRYLDQLLGTKGLFITVFTLLGIAGGANVAYRQIRKVLDEEKKEKDAQDERH